MNADLLQKKLIDFTVANSGHETGRDYLGMSQIWKDEEELASMMLGQEWIPTPEDHLRLDLGKLFEEDIKAKLEDLGLFQRGSERELVASFDSRFRGHTDGELHDGSLLEIKSVTQAQIEQMMSTGRARKKDFQQVQMYLHHGLYRRAFILYQGRDSGEFFAVALWPNRRLIEMLNAKAKRVLARVDEVLSSGRDGGRTEGFT